MEPEWIQAMQEELQQFKLNNVWELVKRPDPRKHNIIGTKWIYRKKQDEHGQVVRNKARLVAQGYTQVEGINFDETFGIVIFGTKAIQETGSRRQGSFKEATRQGGAPYPLGTPPPS